MIQGYDGTIRFNTRIHDEELQPGLDKVKNRLKQAAGTMRDIMQGPVAVFLQVKQAIGGISSAVASMEAEFAASDQAVAILGATLRATGASAWTTSEAVQAMALKFQNMTGYADDVVLSMQNVLLGFKNIKGDNFEAASLQIINMARVMKMDLASAAQAVGKALDDPIAGIDSLTRQGFRWNEQEKEMLKTMVEAGKTAEAQKIIIDALATTFGGAAEAANNTASAIKDKLNVAQGQLREEIGQFLTEALKPLRLELIEATGRFTDWFKTLNDNGNAAEILEGIAIGLASVTGGVIAFMAVAKGHAIVTALATALKAVGAAITANPIGLVAAAITMILIPAIIFLVKNWDDVVLVFKETIAKVGASFKILGSEIEEAFVVGFNGAKIAVLNLAQAVTGPVLNGISKLLEVLGKLPFVGGMFKDAAESVRGFNDNLQGSIDKSKADSTQAIATAKAKQNAIQETQRAQIKAIMDEAKARRAAREAAAQEAKNLKTTVDGLAPAEDSAAPAGTSSSKKDKDKTPAERLADLDAEFAAKIDLARIRGEDTVAVEAAWYKKRLDLLEDFVIVNKQKGVEVAESLKENLGGAYKTIGAELDATMKKQLAQATGAEGGAEWTILDFLPEAAEIAANVQAELDRYTAALEAKAKEFELSQAIAHTIVDFLPEANDIFDNIQAGLDTYTADLKKKAEEFALSESVTFSIMDFLPEAEALAANIKAGLDLYTRQLEEKAETFGLAESVTFAIIDFLPEAQAIAANVKAELDKYTAELTAKAEAYQLTESVTFAITDFLPEAEAMVANIAAGVASYTAELQAKADKYALEQSVAFTVVDFLPEAEAILANIDAELTKYKAELTAKAEAYALEQSVTFAIMDFLPEAEAMAANIAAEIARYTAELQAKADAYDIEQNTTFAITDFLPEATAIIENIDAELARYKAELTAKAEKYALEQSIAGSIMDFLPEAQALIDNIQAGLASYTAELTAKAEAFGLAESVTFSIMDFLPEAQEMMANIQAGLDAYTAELTKKAEAFGLEQAVTAYIMDFLPEAQAIMDNIQAETARYKAELEEKAAAYGLEEGVTFSIESFLPEAEKIAENVKAELARYTAELTKKAEEFAMAEAATFQIGDFLAEANSMAANVQAGKEGPTFDRQVRELSEFGRVINDIEDAWGKLSNDIKKDAEDWSDVLGDVYKTLEDQIAEGMEALGRSIVEGGDAWDGWGTSALRALAGVLRSIGYQILAQVALNTVLGVTALLTGNIAGFLAAGASVLVGLAAAAAAFVGAGAIDAMADQYDNANEAINEHTDALQEQNNALQESRDLFTKASMAAAAYASVLAKVSASAADFYEGLQDTGADITEKVIDGLTQGFGREDFLYAMQEYITESVVKAAVFTDAFMAEAAAIGKEIAAGIAGGFRSDQLQGLKDRLAGLYEQAATAAEIATGVIDSAFGSYDVGTLNVRGDQLARIHNREMILEPGIAEQARTSGIHIGPISSMGDVTRGNMTPAAAQIRISATGTLQVDGREIGRVAFQFADEFQRGAYGSR
jgi:hypothetical protein